MPWRSPWLRLAALTLVAAASYVTQSDISMAADGVKPSGGGENLSDAPSGASASQAVAAGSCPVMGPSGTAAARHTAAGAMSNGDWWPNQLNLKILQQNSPQGHPLVAYFDRRDARLGQFHLPLWL